MGLRGGSRIVAADIIRRQDTGDRRQLRCIVSPLSPVSCPLIPYHAPMSRGLAQFVAVLQLSRVGLVLTAVSNIWVVAMLTRAGGGTGGAGLPMWVYMLL